MANKPQDKNKNKSVSKYENNWDDEFDDYIDSGNRTGEEKKYTKDKMSNIP